MSREAMQMALEALKQLVEHDEYLIKKGVLRHFVELERARTAITFLRKQIALEKKAENARELGLDYEPAKKPDNIGLVVRETTCRQAAPKVVGYGDSTLQSGG